MWSTARTKEHRLGETNLEMQISDHYVIKVYPKFWAECELSSKTWQAGYPNDAVRATACI